MKRKISVTIITKNEENNITRCLESVKWADEIIVVDSGSADRTVPLCRRFGCQVIETDWQGFGLTKQKAVDAASHDWIFSIDADEEVTPLLKEKIDSILKSDSPAGGYRVRRVSFYLGTLIRHSGWNRDYPLRLFDRSKGRFNDKPVHESVIVDGPVQRIREPLLHYTYPDIETHLNKINLYTSIAAERLSDQGKRASLPGAIFRGKLKFLKMYLLRAGFLDGRAGFVLALNSAYGVYLKYLKLWKRNR